MYLNHALKMNLVLLLSLCAVCFFMVFSSIETSELEALLSILPEGNDYSPFRTKIHALAYMLMHSPRPMV